MKNNSSMLAVAAERPIAPRTWITVLPRQYFPDRSFDPNSNHSPIYSRLRGLAATRSLTKNHEDEVQHPVLKLPPKPEP